jgi:hypothetical protein
MSAFILSRPDPSGVRLAVAIVSFLVAANVPYAWLVANFGYDDGLREPAAPILVTYSEGGASLVLAWLAFSAGALLFIPVALEFRRLLTGQGVDDGGAAILGVGSAIAQATGLLRWVLVVPSLAAAFVQPDAGDSVREAIVVTFDVVHRFGGMVIGELLGQLLLAGWTALTVRALWKTAQLPKWLLAGGAATVPLWLLGLTELLHDVLPSLPSTEVTPAAFMLWEAWLAAVAVTMLRRALQRRRHGAVISGA